MAATVYNRLHCSSLSGGGGGGGIGHHSQLARSLERILEEAHLSGELILTNRKLKDFPKTGTKYHLTDTVIADLSRNRFCELPEEITSFSFLETLLLYHNTIRIIPESVKHLTSLTYLDLRSNQLSALPREICFLPLQVLLVSNNRLASLPDELGRMDRLTDLDASYNQLSALPARIGELRSLRSLSLRSNQLMYLPRELTCLTLISLDVSNNRIASLPLEIRQMSTLVEFNLENNPLTSPPASLCVRGLVHVFKFLETQATKEEKGSRAGGNYDGYTTLRRAPRHNSSGNILDSNRVPRHHVDSGYSTCDGIDKRWSNDMPNVKSKTLESPVRRTPTTPPSSLSGDLMDASLTSSTNTIVDESISVAAAVVKPLSAEILCNGSPLKLKGDTLEAPLHQHINYDHSSSSNGSTPDHDELNLMENSHLQHQQQQQDSDQHQQVNGKVDEKLNKNLGNIQTYREYKEALKQQRNQEISSVYKIKGQKTLYDMSEASQALNSANSVSPAAHEEIEIRFNSSTSTLPKSIMKNGTGNANGLNGLYSHGDADDAVATQQPKKPVQKVIPSRNTELMSTAHTNGDCIGYVKPNSPMKTPSAVANGVSPTSAGLNNNKTANVGGTGAKFGTAKTQRSVTWNHDIPSEKLSFTMRREFDRQREETELMTQLRSIIETRLKMTLPDDIASALTDGVILCHLANYVRPRSVASIHVPSPGVSKLTMARCRRNVDNFLEACRKIGVDEELLCSCEDVVPPSSTDADDKRGSDHVDGETIESINNNHEHLPSSMKTAKKDTLPNAMAVAKTVLALIATDTNPYHQNYKNIQQQYELQLKLQMKQTGDNPKQQQQHHNSESQYQESHSEGCYDTNDNAKMYRQQQQEQQQQQQLHLEHEHYQQQQQLTATGTKQQMQQESTTTLTTTTTTTTTTMLNTFEVEAKCHFSNLLSDDQSGNSHNEDGDANDTRAADAVQPEEASDRPHQQQRFGCNNVSNFLRHAKLKTFQKIKLNLITSHGNGRNGSSNNNNNVCASLATTLQTIVETDCDFLGDKNDIGSGVGDFDGMNGPTEAYQLINEKSDHDGVKLKMPSAEETQRKFADAEKPSPGAIVSKRIEFFEHSSAAVNKSEALSVPAAATTLSISSPNHTKSMLKPSSIFSIYRVSDLTADNKFQLKVSDDPIAVEKKAVAGTGASLLRHDSHVLTVILSCVFIVTFLLLVFFPLPG